MSDTLVTFPNGTTEGHATVLAVHEAENGGVVIVDRTPFHPVDHTWPDQPGDRGTITASGESIAVTEAVMAALSDDGVFATGAAIPVRRGTEGWTWQVAHPFEGAAPSWLVAGAEVDLRVDAALRAALSRGHTACHLASLALDLALADLWRKDPGSDPLGSPDFEARANQTSRIHEDGSVDEYRLGKSLRKAGFDTETLTATLAERQQHVNDTLARWVASAATSRIDTDGPSIVDRRQWRCALPEGEVAFLCGGTHVASLDEFAEITVSLDLSDPQLLVMTTTARGASA